MYTEGTMRWKLETDPRPIHICPKDIDVPRVSWSKSLTNLRVAFFFRVQHLSGLLEVVQMEEVVAPARAREPGMLADPPHFRQRRVHSTDPV